MEFNPVTESIRNAIETRSIGARQPYVDATLLKLINENAEPFNLTDPNLDGLIDRLGTKKVVCLGESTHGTEEFYQLRALITERLVREKGFQVVAFEADYPDMDQVNDYIHGRKTSWDSFHRFPTWMWRNTAFSDFADRMREYNLSEEKQYSDRNGVSFHGLDLYSLHTSLDAVYQFLKKNFPQKADVALEAKLCLHPWQHDPTSYGLAVWNEQIEGCREQILKLISEVQDTHGVSLSAKMNALALRSAEDYYRTMFEGNAESWNVRDQHMFNTIENLLKEYGADSKIIVWEHNSHIGNCSATQMALLGEHNVGQLCRNQYKDECYLVGFLSHSGTVLAADSWDGDVKKKVLRTSRPDSYENLFHRAEEKSFCLPLSKNRELKELLKEPRLERAVGVIYVPASERQSHYFGASLSEQFDEIVWLNETTALTPLQTYRDHDAPETYPFGV